MAMAESISQSVADLRKVPSLRGVFRIVRSILSQHRTVEVAHGLACLATQRPGSILATSFDERASEAMGAVISDLSEGGAAAWRSRFPLVDRWLPHVATRAHGACRVGRFTVVGEYGERAARLFLLSADSVRCEDHYERCRGVRHIHCVLPVDRHHFLVSTGDTARYLDRWVIHKGRMRFERTLMRYLGGFTAGVRLGKDMYLGTDFSGRPNYLMRLSDRRRFYLPAGAFLHWIVRMEAVAGRYVAVLGKELDVLGGARSICIFDSREGCFVWTASVGEHVPFAKAAASCRKEDAG